MNKQKIETLLKNSIDNRNIFGISLCISKDEAEYCDAFGNLSTDQPYFIASVTKLYVTAIILRWQSMGMLDVNDPITKYLSEQVTEKLHLYKGTDYSKNITIKHLLSQTSGLPDYFEDKADGQSLLDHIRAGKDQAWTFEDTVCWTKQLKPHFAPGAKNKAHYSDSNFQLLGKIIENIGKNTIAEMFNQLIFMPLNLKQTWLYVNPEDRRPANIYYKTKEMNNPLALSSFKADGGIASTAAETMVFLKAFFSGYFFPQSYFDEMQHWNSVMFPLQYGKGIMRFKLPWIISPFKPIPEFIGHSGLSGSFAFYVPQKKVYFAGTVNQLSNPGNSFRLMMRLLNQL